MKRTIVLAAVLVMAGCSDDGGQEVQTSAPSTTEDPVGPMGTLLLVSGGESFTFGELIEERGLEPLASDYGTVWWERSTHGAFMAGDCHGVTPSMVDPDGDRVEVIVCYGEDGQDEINQR